MHSSTRRPPVALTIAGSDSGGGAGIAADLRVFCALGVYGTAAVTAVTAQDTVGVHDAGFLSPALVARQIEVVLADIGVDAAKTGMLGTRAIVSAVARAVGETRVSNLVVDPVFRSTSGQSLLGEGGLEALRDELLPRARVATPNLAEAEALSGIEIRTLAAAEEAGRAILRLGVSTVIVTGGHWPDDPVDVFVENGRAERLAGRRVPGGGAHGTGCVFSAALAAHLALGREPLDAAREAKRLIESALETALEVGRGQRVLDLCGLLERS